MFKEFKTPDIAMVKERRNKELKLNEFMLKERERLSQKADCYKPLRQKLYEQAVSSAVRKEYSNNECGMHRGYYCPSPVDDLVTGGLKRGKLMKRITKNAKPDHEYLFDSNDKLVAVNSLLDWKTTETEILIYEDNLVTGITFDSYDNSISEISESVYDSDNRIQSFLTASVSQKKSIRTTISDIKLEKYIYDEVGLYETEIIIYTKAYRIIQDMMKEAIENNPTVEMQLGLPDCETSYQHYTFFHDKNGFINRYKIMNPYGDEEYKVLRKVKI